MASCLFCVINHPGIEWKLTQRAAVANDHQFFSRPGHRHIHASDIGKKPDDVFCITTGHADIYDITFLSLETINGIYRDGVK